MTLQRPCREGQESEAEKEMGGQRRDRGDALRGAPSTNPAEDRGNGPGAAKGRKPLETEKARECILS